MADETCAGMDVDNHADGNGDDDGSGHDDEHDDNGHESRTLF